MRPPHRVRPFDIQPGVDILRAVVAAMIRVTSEFFGPSGRTRRLGGGGIHNGVIGPRRWKAPGIISKQKMEDMPWAVFAPKTSSNLSHQAE